MDDSLKTAMQELIALQRSQTTMINNLIMSQSARTNAPANLAGGVSPGAYSGGNPFATHYATQGVFSLPNPAFSLNNSMNGFQGAVSNLAGRNSNYGMIGSLYPDLSRTSNEMRNALSQDYGHRVANASLQGLGAVAGVGAIFAPFKMGMGFLPAMAASTAGSLAIGSYIDIAQDQLKQQQSLQKYLSRESYRFINMSESVNDRGVAGFSRQQTNEASTFVRQLNTSFGLKNEEMMGLLQGFTEGGLLKDVNDLKSFKEKMVDLTKNVKAGALLLNETFDSITDLLAEMKKAGISQKNYSYLLSSGKVLGAELGKDGSEVVRNLIGTASGLTQGTGYNTEDQLNRLQNTTLYVNSMYENLSHQNFDSLSSKQQAVINMVKNLGGPQEAASHLQQIQESIIGGQNSANTKNSMYGLAFYDFDKSSGEFKFNRKAYDSFIKGNSSFEEMTNVVTNKMNSMSDIAKKEWLDNSVMYLKNSNINSMDYIGAITKGYENQLRSQGLDASTDNALAFMIPGLDGSNRNFLSTSLDYRRQNGDAIEKQMKINSALQNLDAISKGTTLRPQERLAGWWENTKEGMTNGIVGLGTKIGDKVQDFSDSIYGKPFSSFYISRDAKSLLSLSGVNSANAVSSDRISKLGNSLDALRMKGYNISSDLVDGLKSYGGSSMVGAFSYERDVIKDPSKLTGAAKENYSAIQEVGRDNKLSESILAALVKFGTTQEGKNLFGASKDTISEIAKRNNMSVNDVSNMDTKEQLKLVGEYMSKLMVDYGGNKTLAMNAFMGGQNNVDAALLAAGYDVSALRKQGRQGELQNIKQGDITIDKSVVTNTSYVNGGAADPGGTGSKGVKGSTIKGGSTFSGSNYYDMDLGTKVEATAEELDAYIASKTKEGSKLRGTGAYFLKAQKEYGINAMTLIAHAALESEWGTSDIVVDKNNFYGIGAFDSSPYKSAYTYKDTEDGILAGAKFIKENYYDKGQTTLRTMNHNNGKHEYATDDEWYIKISNTVASAPENLRNGIKVGGEVSYDEANNYDGNVTKEAIFVDPKTGKVMTSAEYYNLNPKLAMEVDLHNLKKDDGWLGDESRGLINNIIKSDSKRKASERRSHFGKDGVAGEVDISSGYELSTKEKNSILDMMSGVLGINAKDYDSHLAYKDALAKGTIGMYEIYQGQMVEMITTASGEQGNTAFGKMSTTKKAEVIQLMKLLGDSNLGQDLGLQSMDEFMDSWNMSEDDLYTDEEKDLMKHVGEDTSKPNVIKKLLDPSKKGLSRWVMDPNNALASNNPEAFRDWVFDGKRVEYGGLAENTWFGRNFGWLKEKNVHTMSIEDLEKSIGEQIKNTSDENSEAYYKARNLQNKINGDKGSGMFGVLETDLLNKVLNGTASGESLNKMLESDDTKGNEERRKIIEEAIELSKKLEELNDGSLKDLQAELELFNQLKSDSEDLASMSSVFANIIYGDDVDSKEKFLNDIGMDKLTNPEDMTFPELQDALKTGVTTMMNEVTEQINTNANDFYIKISQTLTEDLAKEILGSYGTFSEDTGEFKLNDGVKAEEVAAGFIDALSAIGEKGADAAEQVGTDVEGTVDQFQTATEKYDATLRTWMKSNDKRVKDIEKQIDKLDRRTDGNWVQNIIDARTQW